MRRGFAAFSKNVHPAASPLRRVNFSVHRLPSMVTWCAFATG
jgi:hypothetical protein